MSQKGGVVGFPEFVGRLRDPGQAGMELYSLDDLLALGLRGVRGAVNQKDSRNSCAFSARRLHAVGIGSADPKDVAGNRKTTRRTGNKRNGALVTNDAIRIPTWEHCDLECDIARPQITGRPDG